MKKRKLEPYQKVNLFVVILGIFLISGLSVGYSILSKDLKIKGEITMRAPNIVRVDNINNFTSTNGAYENYNASYNENSITTNIVLPNLTSTVTYTITLKNNTNVNKDIDTISNDLYNNNDIIYELNGANVGTKISANSSITFTITFKYAKNVTVLPSSNSLGSNIKFTFVDNKPRLLEFVKNNQVVTSGDGLYNTAIDTYIYKGNDVNNYLKFSGDNGLYRIINFQSDGTMKIASNDLTTQLAWDANGNRTTKKSPYCTKASNSGCNFYGTTTPASLTYTKNKNVVNDSTIKVWLDNWYKNVSFKNKIVLHNFNGGFVNYNQTPSNMVAQTPNIIYSSYVALLGVDDFFNSFVTMPTNKVYTTVTYNNANYLLGMVGKMQQMWLLNPSNYDTWDVWVVAYGTQFGQKRASRIDQANGGTTKFYVVPSFHVMSNDEFTGTGTSTDPFVIS
jgi:hypothetical protein